MSINDAAEAPTSKRLLRDTRAGLALCWEAAPPRRTGIIDLIAQDAPQAAAVCGHLSFHERSLQFRRTPPGGAAHGDPMTGGALWRLVLLSGHRESLG